MIGISNSSIGFLLDVGKVGVVANVTGSFYEEVDGGDFQVQVSDIDVDVDEQGISHSKGVVPLDVGGIAVTSAVKQLFCDNGCPAASFRSMTVDGRSGRLFQFVVPSAYRLVNPELQRRKRGKYFRGDLSDSEVMLEVLGEVAPVGCILGREDYQDLIFSLAFVTALPSLGLLGVCRKIPLYDAWLTRIVAGDNASGLPTRSVSDDFLDTLRPFELLAILKHSAAKQNLDAVEATFRLLKGSSASFSVKKEGMRIYKSFVGRVTEPPDEGEAQQ